MQQLIHLVYASKETRPLKTEEIYELLSQSRAHNRNLEVTGMLLYSQGSFFQILEGDETTVKALFEKIKRDSRHANVVQIVSEAIYKRTFSDWSMGYAALPAQELERIDGFNDFFSSGRCLADLDTGRAKKLLHAFGSGRWHLD